MEPNDFLDKVSTEEIALDSLPEELREYFFDSSLNHSSDEDLWANTQFIDDN